VLDGKKGILQLRGVRPFLSDKYDYTKHPNYEMTGDATGNNDIDFENSLANSGLRKNEEYMVVCE